MVMGIWLPDKQKQNRFTHKNDPQGFGKLRRLTFHSLGALLKRVNLRHTTSASPQLEMFQMDLVSVSIRNLTTSHTMKATILVLELLAAIIQLVTIMLTSAIISVLV